MKITLPWPPRELSPNARLHHMALHRAKKAYREACYWTAYEQGARKMEAEKLSVTMEFHPPNKHARDLDNCIASMKSGIDGIVDLLGVDDSKWSLTPRLLDEIGGFVRLTVEPA